MRSLTDHIVPGGAAATITIEVRDEPGDGGANHRYMVGGFDTNSNPSVADPDGHRDDFGALDVIFQNGPIPEKGLNGVTNEALLAILIDRMRGFQNGRFKCRENAVSLAHLEDALMWLQKRTRDRMARDVEGKHED